jgi:uncharacterized protein (TIGR03083 family)
MNDRSPSPEKLRPGELRLRTMGACALDPGHLLEVFAEQRRRFVAVLQGFGPNDWAAPTRCADWSAHDVVRHLCDGNAIAAGAGPEDRTLDMTVGFDPRVTPRGWLAASAGESPEATLSRFVTTTEQVLALLRARLAHGRRFDVRLPYGPMDWTILVLHGFWDSWLHERDVLLARGTDHPVGDDATVYAAAYGVFIAAAVASMFGDPVHDKLEFGGDGGGVTDLDSHGAVTLTVTRLTTAGPPAAQVTDALAGRAQTATALGGLSASTRTALTHLAEFFNTPVEPSPSENPATP